MRNCRVEARGSHDARRAVLVLDAGVEANALVANGYRENGPGGQPFTFSGIDLWFRGIGREGISVDGSYENTIVGNAFTHPGGRERGDDRRQRRPIPLGDGPGRHRRPPCGDD